MAKKTEYTKICRGYNTPLLNCVGKKADTEFFNSWSEFDDGKMCYCKKCVNIIYDNYLEKFEDEKSALFYTCAKVDTPFRKDVYETLCKRREDYESNNKKFTLNFGTYINELQKKSTQKEILKDFASTNADITEMEGTTKSLEEQAKELKEFSIIWGNQESIDDYYFLDNTYDRYTRDIEEMSVQQEDLYRDLCRDRLLLRKLSENGCQDNDMITKVQNRVNSLMSKLKIDNFESNQKRTLSEQSFIEKIKMMEETKPIELYPKEKTDYTDYTKRKKYYTDLVLRPLCNTLAGHKDFNIDMSDLEQYNLKGDK